MQMGDGGLTGDFGKPSEGSGLVTAEVRRLAEISREDGVAAAKQRIEKRDTHSEGGNHAR
ncbi:MAG: hypothetical protein BWX47_01513 [candidate division Hyd24-12 bacterium ADurb.Bin004]|nr:MAG: hypothetical protein BWX47_01513 [candidate division Hyd24-12 bacterium ADurb.Bin004]